jgi:hypothetical protein
MPESRDDACNDFTILMLADQHIGLSTTITYRDHELLLMPKREDDMAILVI